jgi:hypothetical protein
MPAEQLTVDHTSSRAPALVAHEAFQVGHEVVEAEGVWCHAVDHLVIIAAAIRKK